LNLPDPLLQLGFATLLDAARDRILLEALRQTVGAMDIQVIDAELAGLASAEALARLAAHGIRGETYFPAPSILRRRPSLLAYYRMLYGYSQKQFYQAATGATKFRSMEVRDKISSTAEAHLDDLCSAFARSGEILLSGLGSAMASSQYPNELCLLTFGAQLRGSSNNTKGSDGIKTVFAVLKAIFEDETEQADNRSLTLQNAVGRKVKVELAADPDVLVSVDIGQSDLRTVVAIEVKAGEDHSNIWNRMGEAEKSHLKARERGVTECWTIINDLQAPEAQLKASSPSTNRFYQLVDLTNPTHSGRADFAARVRSMVGL
jgi:XcyI restriction endonuclease